MRNVQRKESIFCEEIVDVCKVFAAASGKEHVLQVEKRLGLMEVAASSAEGKN